jgi:hypothetical protein
MVDMETFLTTLYVMIDEYYKSIIGQAILKITGVWDSCLTSTSSIPYPDVRSAVLFSVRIGSFFLFLDKNGSG